AVQQPRLDPLARLALAAPAAATALFRLGGLARGDLLAGTDRSGFRCRGTVALRLCLCWSRRLVLTRARRARARAAALRARRTFAAFATRSRAGSGAAFAALARAGARS